MSADNNKDDDILGVWSCKQTLTSPAGTDTDYFTETYNEDGTNMFSNTGLNSQTASFAPMGLYGTPAHGIWKKLNNGKFFRVATFLVNAKLPAFGIVPDFIAGTPVARARIECTINVSKNGNNSTIEGNINFTSLENSPPLPPFTFKGSCTRLKF